MTGNPEGGHDRSAVFAGRIDILFALGRHYLSLPFAALCIPATLFAGREPGWLPLMPLMLQITVVIAAEQLTTAYRKRNRADDPRFWAWRYTFVSAIAGATWGVGVLFWFVPNSFPAEAYLSLAFLGMTATEFIARSAYRPAYLAHALFSLGPLVAVLLMAGGLYQVLSAVLVTLFGGVLFTYCNGMGRLLDESIFLRLENVGLVTRLSREKVEVEAARDAAQASGRVKSSFLANISHELRTPLNALLGMAQLLDRSELEKPHRDHVKVMLEAGKGLQMLLDDVIALSRDDDGELADEDCDPVQATRAVGRLLQPRAWEKRLRLTVTVTPNLPHVAIDGRRLRQALLKLVDNALKFTERGGVEIRAETDGEAVRFTVSDTGQGVLAGGAATLFKPFAPGDVSYARRQQGMGLGLAVVKRIVESAKGAVGFDSVAGEGSSFWFTIPLSSDFAQADADMPAPDTTVPPSKHVFLVFTREAAIDGQIARFLEPFGNTVTGAANLADAIALSARAPFDALIVSATDADNWAAAPGVTAPVLALLTRGERAPATASEVLRWPASAQELYSVLAVLQARSKPDDETESAGGTQVLAPIDADAFAALEKSLGLNSLLSILQSYIENAELLCSSLSEACAAERWDDASRLAQDIAGAAGGLGLIAVTAAARGFTQKTRQGESRHELRNAAQIVVGEQVRARQALGNLYPDLVA
ncbi:MAG TPA: ATP-binding protein [Rhizomicrobium sp.]|jgi:signal transduction histidine kinase/HPt (histidine-containing phosphotransfer) domain-containing protein|nr:ATP-binding protein [Rhizomicrobium sp.]